MSKTKREYDEVSVVRDLSKKKGCNINGKTIHIDSNQSDIGNTSWGKIDYLCKNHDYVYTTGNESSNKHHRTSGPSTHPKVREVKNSEPVTKPAKFNMANMSKNAMKSSIVK